MENTNEKGKAYMRLHNIYFICKSCFQDLDNVNVVEKRDRDNSVVCLKILNWGGCKKTFPELRRIDCLRDQIENVCNVLNFKNYEEATPEVSIQVGKKFEVELNILIASVTTIIDLYESMEIGESSCGIDVKIPQCDSLKEYMDYLKEIDFIFTQCPYLKSGEDEVKFKNVDIGSQWLSFAVGVAGGFGILNNLAKLIERAIAVKSYLKTVGQQDEMLKAMQLKNEVAEETIETFKTMKRVTMEGYVKNLESELGELKDGEERGKVEKSLEKLAVLIDKGVEVYSSIETPNEIKALFPANENNVLLTDNIIKLLEKKDEENAE